MDIAVDYPIKQYKYLYSQMLDENIIRKAYKKLRKGKTKRKEIQEIDTDLDAHVKSMQKMIKNTKPEGVEVEDKELAFKPTLKTPRRIREHKKWRKIYIPPMIEQWIHHIIILILEPIITRFSYQHSCGSMPGRGGSFGRKTLNKWIKSGRAKKYFVKGDIRHFYDNIRIDILIKELRKRIVDEWFVHFIKLCFYGIKKGLPLGFYISQWLSNYLLEPLDRLIVYSFGYTEYVRYVDDFVYFGNNKKQLLNSIVRIKEFLGQNFRLKLKDNYQVVLFHYIKKNGKVVGGMIDFMGYQFFRTKTLMRKSIMLAVSKTARKLHSAKENGRRYFERHVKTMLSYNGWLKHTDSYDWYLEYIKPNVDFRKLKHIASKLDKQRNKEVKTHDPVERRILLPAA